jgi:chromosome segregation ATPase
MVLTIASLVAALLLGSMAWVKSRQVNHLEVALAQSLEERDSSLEQSTDVKAKIESLQTDVERADKEKAELLQLRAKVSSLQRELDQARLDLKKQASRAPSHSDGRESGETIQSSQQNIPVNQLPLQIRNSVLNRYPDAVILEAERIVETEGVRYALAGTVAGDRELHAIIDENGTVLEQEIELAFSQVPQAVRASLSQEIGADRAMEIHQVWEDGRTRYTGNTEVDGQDVHMVFTEDGQLIRYETWVEEPDLNDPDDGE